MIPRLHSASSRLLVSTRAHTDVRLTFSSSAALLTRRQPQRPVRERAQSAAADWTPRGNEDGLEESEPDADEMREEEELNSWLLAGTEKVNESEIRSYRDPYGHFLKNIAPSFRTPSPRNWLGRDVPFPLNLSFKPPIPLSDNLRNRLYRAYMIDPKLNSVRALAARHNLSIKRVDAVLRLKSLEKAWEKVPFIVPPQPGSAEIDLLHLGVATGGFTKGMEYLLGVTDASKHAELDSNGLPEVDQRDQPDAGDRCDVHKADIQAEAEGNGKARHRYQRLFWESVAEGEDPIMPGVLEGERRAALARTKFGGKTTLVERVPGRPAIMFVDVGNAFVDEKEKERREREGVRRSSLQARKRMRDRGLHA